MNWEKDRQGNQTVLYTGDRDGISIRVNKGRKSFYISGWYDGFVGIEGKEITLKELQDLVTYGANQ